MSGSSDRKALCWLWLVGAPLAANFAFLLAILSRLGHSPHTTYHPGIGELVFLAVCVAIGLSAFVAMPLLARIHGWRRSRWLLAALAWPGLPGAQLLIVFAGQLEAAGRR